MHKIVSYISPVLEPLRLIWTADTFKHSKQGAMELVARKAIQSEDWTQQFRVISDLVAPMHDTRLWGSGCYCCERLREEGKKVDCMMAGLRMPDVRNRLEAFEACVEEEVDSPHMDWDICTRENISADLWEKRSYGFTLMKQLAVEGLGCLRSQPYSLSEVDDTVTLKRERDHWETLPSAKRHRVADGLFDPAGS